MLKRPPEQLPLVSLDDGLVMAPHRTAIRDPQYAAGRLVQCTLPHSDPGDVPQWQRVSKAVVLTIRPWRDALGPRYPYGVIPRLLLYWLVSEAVVTKSRRIELGANMAHFTRNVGLSSSQGGERSDTTRLMQQTQYLFQAGISTEILELPGEPRRRWMNMGVTRRGDMWWEPVESDGSGGWQGWIDLGEDFFDNITRGPVPLSFDVLRTPEIRRSPLALDLYAYLTHRSDTARRFDKPLRISWVDLHEQLGSHYARPRDFRLNALKAIAKLLSVYPALRVHNAGENLVVLPSLPSVPVVF